MSEELNMDESTRSRQWNWFWYFIDISKNKFLYNDSSFVAAIGKRRSGKSVLCLSSACAVDPDFSTEQVCFGLKELKEQLNEKTQTSIVWEEAGASAYSRDFMDERNKIISKTLQVYGYRKIALFGNFQHLKFLDGDIRLQIDYLLRMKAYNLKDSEGKPFTRTFGEPFAVVTDYIQEPVIAPYKVAKDGVFQSIGKIPIPDMWDFFEICGVSKGLYKDYLKRKDEYFMDIGEEEKEEKEEIFSKRELKTLTRVNQAYLSLASRLIEDKVTKTKIAEFSGIPVSTLNVWLGKSEDAEEWAKRILEPSTTTTNFF